MEASTTTPVASTNGAAETHPGLQDFLSYPLAQALQDRRTRRVAQGVSIEAGGVSHRSTNPPSPLTKLEEAILIASVSRTGSVGAVMMDGPLKKPDGHDELGSPFLHMVGRGGSSADNAQATSMFMINDEGTWLIERPHSPRAREAFDSIPRRWEDRTEADWLAFGEAVKRKVYDQRLDAPREFPYYLGWNAQHSNAPGTTVFLPVVDNTRQYINALLILLTERKGRMPLFIDDFSPFRPKGAMEWAAWAASKAGLVEEIPYHPIGGLKRVRGGWSTKDAPAPLNGVGAARTDHEAFFLLQNLLLVGEGLRLGGWIHSALLPPHLTSRDLSKGVLGLGFRQHPPKQLPRWRRKPPVPASQPNPVGIDGVLEGLCPPYVRDMDEAVDRLLEEKYGPDGCYGDPAYFGQAYRDQSAADAYLKDQKPHPPEAVRYTKEICRYLYETYGRFPAHTDAYNLPGIWAQFSHLEIEYYEKYAKPQHFQRQAEGRSIWQRS